MINIFIANLDWSITSEDLLTTFSSFGEVTYAHVVYEKQTKRSKGYGYVEMHDTDHAINAIQALNGMEVNGRKLDVKIASPKGNRPPRKEEVKKEFARKPPFKKRIEGNSEPKFSRAK
jgi:RNA recognition motif-containing protein